MKKAAGLLGLLQEQLVQDPYLHAQLPPETRNLPPKISKGEQYRGLPYLILDFPRLFAKQDVFACRTMFWWGHYFSFTLHLKGVYRDRYLEHVVNGYDLLRQESFHVCTGDAEWEHHLEQPHYVPVNSWNEDEFAEHLHKGSLLKLARSFPLQEWNNIPRLLHQCHVQITRMLLD